MARLQIRLLGPFEAILAGEPVAHFETQKARALLAYLAAETEQPQQRDFLAEMLWPDRPEGAARANLRHTLGNLRTILEDPFPSDESLSAPPFLLVTRESIQVNPAADLLTDTTVFIRLVTGSIPVAKLPIQRLEEAVDMYRGSFLQDLCIGDSAIFQEWVLLKREQFQCQILKVLNQLAKCYATLGMNDRALEHAWRWVSLSPWDEEAHQQVMRLLALTGQQGAALDYYGTCLHILVEELGVEPGEDTKQLYEQIRSGKLKIRTTLPNPSYLQQAFHLPAFLREDAASAEPPVFVAREHELAKLDNLLNETLQGQFRLAFVVGDAGQGKTALLNEFARRAMNSHPELLVASGNCNTYSGIGDPYLPFRDVLAMLTGDVEARWAAGLIGREHARRLWETQSLAIQALVAGSGSLIDTILSGEELIFRAAIAAPDHVDWLERLEDLTSQRRTVGTDLEQSHMFEQYMNVLRFLADQHPLVLLLDDMQWADSSSISLLFHLGRRLTGSRVLIICAYRPDEVISGTAGEQHALAKVLLEFKRIFGDVWLDLNQAEQEEGRRFVDDFLDTEPNRLTQAFRNTFFHRTDGHPLFTIELLRSMQEQGDLLIDVDGCWVSAPTLDWELIPARVEAVIEERVSRLGNELQQILSVACVEGEIFTAQVVAEVHKIAEKPLLNLLSQQFGRLRRLVREHETVQTECGRIFHYKFSHVLFRDYLYKRLSQEERQVLHGEVAAALERLFEGRLDEIAAQLAHHFRQAGAYDLALKYLRLAAERAARIYANDEAIKYYTQGIEGSSLVAPNTSVLADLYHGRGLAWEKLGDFEHACADHGAALQITYAAGEHRLEWRALIDLGRLWASRDYDQSIKYYEQALKLARRINHPSILANSLNWMGNWHINAENPNKAIEAHQEALTIIEATGNQRDLANTLDLLGIASLLGGDCKASATYYNRAIALFRELDDRPSLASSLTGRGNIGGAAYCSLTLAPTIKPCDAQRDFEEAIQLARETNSPASEAWALWSLGLLCIVQGNLGYALDAIQNGLRIASEIDHLEWMVGNQAALGVLYLELFEHEEARRYLEQALVFAKELRSQHWIHQITGSLAATFHFLGDLEQAQTCLETVITPHTPMDTMHKRYCWARRAELAFSQGDPALALEISDRLIASSLGMAPGQVLTFVWKLKGEALATLGHTSEATTLLREALKNAQTTGERFLLWRVHASLGHLCLGLNNPGDAHEEFCAASELIDELATTISDARLKDKFLQGAHRLIKFPNPK